MASSLLNSPTSSFTSNPLSIRRRISLRIPATQENPLTKRAHHSNWLQNPLTCEIRAMCAVAFQSIDQTHLLLRGHRLIGAIRNSRRPFHSDSLQCHKGEDFSLRKKQTNKQQQREPNLVRFAAIRRKRLHHWWPNWGRLRLPLVFIFKPETFANNPTTCSFKKSKSVPRLPHPTSL